MGMEMEMEIQIIPRAFFGQAQVGIDVDILYFSRNINCKILFKKLEFQCLPGIARE